MLFGCSVTRNKDTSVWSLTMISTCQGLANEARLLFYVHYFIVIQVVNDKRDSHLLNSTQI